MSLTSNVAKTAAKIDSIIKGLDAVVGVFKIPVDTLAKIDSLNGEILRIIHSMDKFPKEEVIKSVSSEVELLYTRFCKLHTELPMADVPHQLVAMHKLLTEEIQQLKTDLDESLAKKAEDTQKNKQEFEVRKKEEEEENNRLKTIHNEQTKLSSGFVNTAGTALFGGGLVTPLVAASLQLTSAPQADKIDWQIVLTAMIVWGLMGLGLHYWARNMLQVLR